MLLGLAHIRRWILYPMPTIPCVIIGHWPCYRAYPRSHPWFLMRGIEYRISITSKDLRFLSYTTYTV